MGTLSSQASGSRSLFGQTRCTLLALLYGRADQSFHFRQLARAIGTGHGALQRELRSLVEIGLIVRKTQGNQVLYPANSESPIFSELKSLMVKTAGIHDAIRSALAPLSSQIEIAFIFGSVARQQERANSDVDLMVLGNIGFAELVSALGPAQRTLDPEINPTVFPVAEFRAKLAAGNHFLKSEMREKKVFVLGSEHELTALAAK